MNHSTAWDLIPWIVNGRAMGDEREALEEHVAKCAQCRTEVAAQRSVMEAMTRDVVIESMPNASFQKLWARIDATQASQAPAPRRDTRHTRVVGWLAAAIAAEALLVGALSLVLYEARGSSPQPAYRTVSTAAAPVGSARVRAVFSPTLTLGELQALLERAKLRIVAGPSQDGVYSLALATPADDAQLALLTLRSHPAARFAESIDP